MNPVRPKIERLPEIRSGEVPPPPAVEAAAVLTFATHEAFEFRAFFRSALVHGVSPKLLGWQTAEEGALHRKVTAVAAEIANYDDERIVLFVDA